MAVSAGDCQAVPELPGRAAACGWRLRLFVAGGHGRSRRAIENLRLLCATHLPPGTEVEVVDVFRPPSGAAAHGVAVAPTLVRLSPLPVRQVAGDLSDTPSVLRGLDLGEG